MQRKHGKHDCLCNMLPFVLLKTNLSSRVQPAQDTRGTGCRSGGETRVHKSEENDHNFNRTERQKTW